MKMSGNEKALQAIEVKEDFNWGATIAVMMILLMFLGSILYVLVSSFGDA